MIHNIRVRGIVSGWLARKVGLKEQDGNVGNRKLQSMHLQMLVFCFAWLGCVWGKRENGGLKAFTSAFNLSYSFAGTKLTKRG